MARNTQSRSVSIPYRVGIRPGDGASPAEAIRAVYEELSKVAQALADYDRPVSVSLRADDTINIAANPALVRLFDNGATSVWEQPGGAFDPATGIWKCPQEGLYTISVSVSLEPLAGGNGKSYSLEIVSNVDRIGDWIPDEAATSYAGGIDDQYVTVAGTLAVPMARGDRVWFEARAIHPNKTGTEGCKCTLSIVRDSGIGSTR